MYIIRSAHCSHFNSIAHFEKIGKENACWKEEERPRVQEKKDEKIGKILLENFVNHNLINDDRMISDKLQ